MKIMNVRKIILVSSLVLLYQGYLIAQIRYQKGIDTVYLLPDKTTSIILPGQILTVDVGKKTFAQPRVYKNSVFIKPELYVKNGESTSLIIQFLGENQQMEYYSALLMYTDDKDKKFYYDKRASFEDKSLDPVYIKKQKQKEYIHRVKRKIDLLENLSADIKDVGDFKENIIMLLRIIRIDEKNLYLSFEVQNNSTIDFNIANIDLSYVKKIKRGLFKKTELQREPIGMILGNKPIGVIYGNQSRTISFALPIYGLKSRDYLQVMFREYSGNRNLEFKVFGKTITKYAKYLLLEEEQYFINEKEK